MKRIFLFSLCILSALTLTACSGQKEAVKSLTTELNSTQNAIYETSMISTNSWQSPQSDSFSTLISQVQTDAMTEQEACAYISMQINEIEQSLGYTKLSKEQVAALKSLTKQLRLYTQGFKNTAGTISSSIKSAKKYSKPKNFNQSQIEASYLSLSNCMNARIAYLSNILACLDQIQTLTDSDSAKIAKIEIEENKGEVPVKEETSRDKNINIPQEPIINNDEEKISDENSDNTNDEKENERGKRRFFGKNTDTYMPFRSNIDTYRPFPQNDMGYGGYGYGYGRYNGYGGGYNNFGGYGYDGYGYNNYYNRMPVPANAKIAYNDVSIFDKQIKKIRIGDDKTSAVVDTPSLIIDDSHNHFPKAKQF